MMRYSDGMMVRMQIQFTEEQAAELRGEAKQRGVSISSIVRERCLSTSRSLPSRRDALAKMGTFSSGRSDISSNHDEHLADAYHDWSDA